MSAEFKINGLPELRAALTQIPGKLQRNVMRSALRAGAAVIRADARARVPVKTGTLRAGISVGTSSRGADVSAKVSTKGKHAYLAPWIEYGTAAHPIKGRKGGLLAFAGIVVRKVDHPGARPRPFMRPAMEASAPAALQAVFDKVRQRLTAQGLDTPEVDIEEVPT